MSFFEELKRRNVFRVGIAYGVAAWVLLQVADLVLEAIEAPSWVLKALMLVIGLGFIAALVIAWAYELTSEGIKKESEVDRSQSVVTETGRKMDRIIIAFLVVAVAVLLYRQSGVSENAETAKRGSEPISSVASEQAPSDESEKRGLTPNDKSIAVLPFTTRSTSEDDKFFSDGMHDDLLTQLAKIGSLKVISRTSMMEYRETTKNLRQIGEELGVANILEGAVQRVGKQVRINVQLIDADTDEHLWAETYDREMSLDNLLSIQSEMSRAIASAMQTTLSPQEEALLDRRMTENIEALDAYRRAKNYSEVFDAIDLARAEREIQHALELDPNFVAAWALKAYIHMSTYWGISDKKEHRDAALAAINRGRAIEPDSPDLDLAEGYYYYWGFLDYEAALKVLEPVLKVYPNDVELLKVLSYVNRRYGEFDTSYDYMEKAYALAPRDIRLIYAMGETKTWMSDWKVAQNFLDQLQSLDPIHPRTLQLRAAIISLRDNKFTEAARIYAMVPKETLSLGSNIWTMFIYAQDYESAMAASTFGEDKESADGPMPPAMTQGITYLLAGEHEKALPLLEQARDFLQQWYAEEPDDWYLLRSLCMTVGALADREMTKTMCDRAASEIPNDAFDRSFNYELIANGYAMAGLENQAIDLLEKIAESRVTVPVSMIAANPMFESLHNTKRWQALMLEHGIEQ
ncbi:MAG: TolB-like protein/Tfp pilus assembly protein PilF [Rhodothermales bacterium]